MVSHLNLKDGEKTRCGEHEASAWVTQLVETPADMICEDCIIAAYNRVMEVRRARGDVLRIHENIAGE